jgi:hypothetical protein
MRAKVYRREIDRDLSAMDFSVLYVEGLRLANADHAAAAEIARGELPPLAEAEREALDTLLQLHGTFMLSTATGAELLAAERAYQRRPSEESKYRAAAIDFAASLQHEPTIIAPDAAAFVLGAAEQIGQGSNPERSDVAGTSTLHNVTVVIAAAAAVAALPVVGALLAGPPGAIAGGLTGLLAGEGLKKSKPFATVIAPIIARLDHAATADFSKYKIFLLSIEEKARRLASRSDGFGWLGKAVNWVKGDKSQGLTEPVATHIQEEEPFWRYGDRVLEKVFGAAGPVSVLGEYRSIDYDEVSIPVPRDGSDETPIAYDIVSAHRNTSLSSRWWQEFTEAAEVKPVTLFLVISERPIGFETEQASDQPRVHIKKFPGWTSRFGRVAVFVDLSGLERQADEHIVAAARETLISLAKSQS